MLPAGCTEKNMEKNKKAANGAKEKAQVRGKKLQNN
jgi:hypothetical protein